MTISESLGSQGGSPEGPHGAAVLSRRIDLTILRKHLVLGTCSLGIARVPQPKGTRPHLKSGGPRSLSVGRCWKGLRGFGLRSGHLGKGSKKQGFALDWLLSGIEGDSQVGICGLLFLEGVAGGQATSGAGR